MTIPSGLSFLVWDFTCIYCLMKYNDRHPNCVNFPCVTFSLTLANALLATVEYFGGTTLYSTRSLIDFLQMSLALPCLTTEVWLIHNAAKEFAYLHTVIGCLPTYYYIFRHHLRQDLLDFAVIFNLASLMFMGFFTRSWTTLATVISFYIAFFSFRRCETIGNLSPVDLFNVSMSFFTYFGMLAVIDDTHKDKHFKIDSNYMKWRF